jgi:site-specific DNA-methyltransferase (adenine-specific)
LYFRKGVKLNTTFETASTYWQTPLNQKDKAQFLHPTCKPLSIIKTIIGNSTKENDIVLDCFMGSGTTAVACQETSRNFVGFEIEKKWVEIA